MKTKIKKNKNIKEKEELKKKGVDEKIRLFENLNSGKGEKKSMSEVIDKKKDELNITEDNIPKRRQASSNETDFVKRLKHSKPNFRGENHSEEAKSDIFNCNREGYKSATKIISKNPRQINLAWYETKYGRSEQDHDRKT